jgi:hypothetical protein
MPIRNCTTCQVEYAEAICPQCTGPNWPNWADGSEEPDALADAYAKISELQQQIDAVYKAYCGRDLMHLPLVDAVGKVMDELRGFDEARADVIGSNGNDGLHYDAVNHPPHYTQGGIECIDAIKAALTPEEWRGYCKGNALKYVWRERHKGGDESLQKAAWYLASMAK